MADEFDEVNGESQDGDDVEQVDPVRNVQAEMNRKIENTNKIIEQQAQQLQQLMDVIKAQNTQAAPPQQKLNYKEAIFDNPDAFVDDVVRRASQTADETINRRLQTAQTTQQAAADVAAKYTEFANPASEAYLLAIQKEAKQSPNLRGTPEGVRLAMMDAVAELGLTPASKRQRQAEDFTLGAQGTGGSANRKRSQGADLKKDIDPATLQMAELLGVDLNDPKRVAGLAKASSRKRWNSYE